MAKKKNLFYNIMEHSNPKCPFKIYIGGRGTGKTYSALSAYARGDLGTTIIMRRTANELEIIGADKNGDGANPFKAVYNDHPEYGDYGLHKMRSALYGLYLRDVDEDGKPHPIGAPLGYGVALSNIASIRGVDFSDVDTIIYDEFIPESHVRKIKNEGTAFLNAYESINRNRELLGKPPVTAYLLSNSNNIYHDLLIQLGLVPICEAMVRKGQEDKILVDRGIELHLIKAQGLREQKAETALYKATRGTHFSEMALDNKFTYNDFSLIGYRKTTEYRPVACIDDFCYLWKHKSNGGYYVTYNKGSIGFLEKYRSELPQERRMFCMTYLDSVNRAYVRGMIIFESYELKMLVLDIIGLLR